MLLNWCPETAENQIILIRRLLTCRGGCTEVLTLLTTPGSTSQHFLCENCDVELGARDAAGRESSPDAWMSWTSSRASFFCLWRCLKVDPWPRFSAVNVSVADMRPSQGLGPYMAFVFNRLSNQMGCVYHSSAVQTVSSTQSTPK